MRMVQVRQRLHALPDPLPRVPRSVGPIVVGEPARLPEWVIARGAPRRRAAALVLLYADANDEATLVLTERPTGELRHPGQISLPGGAEEAEDDFPVGTAVREAAEEIGLDAAAAGVETLGLLGTVDVPVSGFILSPVLAVADRTPQLTPHAREVASILHVPVADFLPGAPMEIVEEERDGYRLRFGVYSFGGHRIWGATARVLCQLGEILGEPGPAAGSSRSGDA